MTQAANPSPWRTRRTLSAVLGSLAILLLAGCQGDEQSAFTRSMGIDQKLGATVPLDVKLQDETGATRTFGSVLQGRPVLVLPFPLKKTAGCGVVSDGLQKTLFKADHPNARALIAKKGENALAIGKTFDVVFLSLDPSDRPTDAAQTKIDFQKKVDEVKVVEPVTAFTGDLASLRKVADGLGFRFYYDAATKSLRNPTGSVLLTPDGHISSYTIGNDFPTKVLESNLDLAKEGKTGGKADQNQMFGCVQLASSVIDRRGKIEAIITGFALLTLAIVVFWIGSMLRSERRTSNPGGPVDA